MRLQNGCTLVVNLLPRLSLVGLFCHLPLIAVMDARTRPPALSMLYTKSKDRQTNTLSESCEFVWASLVVKYYKML